jgi:hypothetical protein
LHGAKKLTVSSTEFTEEKKEFANCKLASKHCNLGYFSVSFVLLTVNFFARCKDFVQLFVHYELD